MVLLTTLLGATAAHAQTYQNAVTDSRVLTAHFTGAYESPRPTLATPFTPSRRGSLAPSPGEITLRSGLFKPLRYSYSDGALQKVYRMSGLSFTDGFEEVISRHPQAFEEARKARVYSRVAFGGSALVLVGSVQMLLGTIEAADAVNQGNLYAGEESLEGVGTMLVGAAVMAFGSALASSALKRSVRMFNERQQVQAGTAGHTQ